MNALAERAELKVEGGDVKEALHRLKEALRLLGTVRRDMIDRGLDGEFGDEWYDCGEEIGAVADWLGELWEAAKAAAAADDEKLARWRVWAAGKPSWRT